MGDGKNLRTMLVTICNARSTPTAAIEERYKRWVHPDLTWRSSRQSILSEASGRRLWDRKAGHCVCFPVRYADDFVVLVSGTQEEAIAEKSALAKYLQETTGLELSPEKTKIPESAVLISRDIQTTNDPRGR